MKQTHFRKILESKGISPTQLADLGMSYGTVLAHYYGRRQMSLQTAKRYAKLLKIPLLELIDTSTPAKEDA